MGRSCLCVYWSEVLSVPHIFIIINSIPISRTYLEKGEAVSSEQCEHAERAETSEPQTVRIRDMFKRRPSAAGLHHVRSALRDLGTLWHTYSIITLVEHEDWVIKS